MRFKKIKFKINNYKCHYNYPLICNYKNNLLEIKAYI